MFTQTEAWAQPLQSYCIQGRCFKHYYSAITPVQKRRGGEETESMVSRLVRLLAQSDSSCFFQPGVFGVERVHTIPEQEGKIYTWKGQKQNILFIKEIFWPLSESASLLLKVEQHPTALGFTVPFKNAVTGVIAPPGGHRCLGLVPTVQTWSISCCQVIQIPADKESSFCCSYSSSFLIA